MGGMFYGLVAGLFHCLLCRWWRVSASRDILGNALWGIIAACLAWPVVHWLFTIQFAFGLVFFPLSAGYLVS